MLDVTELIFDDHALLRKRFAAFDDARGVDQLGVLWDELTVLLDAHAACEEEVFYPALLKKATEGGEDEAEDAIDDHNKIRDAIRAAATHRVDTKAWWEAVGVARTENSKHIAEEEREALPDFRKSASLAQRAELAVAWTKWHTDHFRPNHVKTRNPAPEAYIEANS